jgi:hypothetical protein
LRGVGYDRGYIERRKRIMLTIHHYPLVQGTPEWDEIKRGKLSASEMKLLITPKTMKIADNDKTRALVWKKAAERITGRTIETFQNYDMMRGHIEEIRAREMYPAEVTQCGFIELHQDGMILGYSPDGLVGYDGLIEIKSANQTIQVQRIVDNVCPEEHILQCQTGLYVTKRKWIDFISFSNGMEMLTVRVYPDAAMQEVIHAAWMKFEADVAEKVAQYKANAKGLPVAEWVENLENIDINI